MLTFPCAYITGCAVAQHRYNGDFSFLWENGNLTPCKIETLEQIDTQFVTSGVFIPNLVNGGLLGKGVKYNFFCDFIYLFIYFSDQVT